MTVTSMSQLPRPTHPAPPLAVSTVGGSPFILAERRPPRFTMVVFYRGLHCPVCRTYLGELASLLGDYAERGVDVIAVSGDDETRAREAAARWNLGALTIGYGQTVDSMRAWGLFVSRAIKEPEPPLFAEPGLFLIRPDATVHYVAVNSLPFGRPSLREMLGALDFIIAKDYPARGEA